MKQTIVPKSYVQSSLNFHLDPDVTEKEIKSVLGFKPNVKDDPDKVTASWGFTVDGVDCAIWDYKSWRWSCFGPREIFEKLFPGKVLKD